VFVVLPPPEIVERWGKDRTFINGYGPTEVTVCATLSTCQPGQPITLGRPFANTRVYILDDLLQPVPIGVPGEICVGGVGVSPGYLNGDGANSEKFIPNPHLPDGDRLYRTGDLGRLLPDGCLEHLGRKDFQVKIRGYRIEVAEIEMALLALENIKAAVVVARNDQPGRKRLVAYIVPVEKSPPTVSTLRHALAEKFPDYMIPSAFVMLRALPLTPSGKVDRSALPAPGGTRPHLDTPFAAPRTVVEEELTQIWAEVLSFDQVGINDNFFDLGGHSLAATQIISRVVRRFRLELPIQSLFQAPTVAEMAAVITQIQELSHS